MAQAAELPDVGRYLWQWWKEVDSLRPRANGAEPITWQEFEAWERWTGRALELWERKALLALEQAFQDALAAAREREAERLRNKQ